MAHPQFNFTSNFSLTDTVVRSDLKELVLKHNQTIYGRYNPLVGAQIDIDLGMPVVSEDTPDLYQTITNTLAQFKIPIFVKSVQSSQTPGLTENFQFYPVGQIDPDADYVFIGYDGAYAQTVTVHNDNSVSYRTVANGIHRLMEVWNEDADPAPYGYWIADLEKPNPDAPCGYEWAYAHDILEGIRNGEVFVLYCYAAFPTDTTTPVMHMTKIENQSGVDSLGNHYEAVRIYFDSCSYTGEPGRYAATSIYTPDIYDTSHTGRMAVLNWDGSVDRFVNFKLANADFVEKNYNKVQSLDNNSAHYPSCPAVKEAIDTAVASAYHAAGTKTVAQLTSALLVADNQGNVYNITDSGTTTADFVDGAGHPIAAGDNVGVCDIGGGVYKFDLLSGFVDLSGYLAKTGDGSDVTSTFTKASGDTSSMVSGGKLSAIFTTISSFFSTLVTRIAGKADDNTVVHLAGTETITGQKTFSGNLPILQNDSTSLKLNKKILFSYAGTDYNSWDSNLKDGNHYRRWRIKLGIDSTALFYLVVNVYSVWNRVNSAGVLSAKYTVFSDYVNKSFYSNSKCYLSVDSIDTAREFRLSPAIYDDIDGYCIDIVSSKPASDNPISVVIDVGSNLLTEITLSDVTIIEGWPSWAGDINVAPRMQSNGRDVMLAGDVVNNTVNVNQSDSNTEISSFTFVNGHIYHLTAHLEGSPLLINTSSSGIGYVVAYIGSSISGSHYNCRQLIEIQNGELTTNDIKLPIDWKAENITDSSDNKLHLVVVFNNTMYSFTSASNYDLTLMGTDFNGA